jgi:hypothetical protein
LEGFGAQGVGWFKKGQWGTDGVSLLKTYEQNYGSILALSEAIMKRSRGAERWPRVRHRIAVAEPDDGGIRGIINNRHVYWFGATGIHTACSGISNISKKYSRQRVKK